MRYTGIYNLPFPTLTSGAQNFNNVFRYSPLVNEVLKRWVIELLRARDVVKQDILDFEDRDSGFIVKRKSGDQLVLIRPVLDDFAGILSSVSGNKVALIVLNKKSNVEALIKSWDRLRNEKDLCIFFVNPSRPPGDDKWLVFPYTHELVTDKKSLKLGLMALYESVGKYNG